MIAIIAEKPSVGREIARIAGATEAKDGYMEGNGYSVTWALGHLVQLALPGTYGYTRTSGDNLPLLPDPFQLVIRQRKTDRGMATDPVAAKQLRTIDSVFSRCSAIIVATDAGREGELIFRYIYSYLGYTKPFRRLWISSLTDEAIRKGLSELKEGTEYDSLYHAADCRAKADWLVGINASQALAIASGTFNQSLGRVQTPTLAMICARFKENREFVPTDYWQLSVTLKKGDDFRQFRHVENIPEKTEADRLYDRITTDSMAAITKTERKRGFQAPPLLYDLTALQKDCNVHLDLSAEKTLAVAQSLYEKKLISYPRTGSRYIPDDVMRQVPDLLRGVIGMKEFREYGDCSVGNTPQLTGFAGLNYYGPKGWGVQAEAAWAGNRFVEPSLVRRTSRIARQQAESPEAFELFTRQERLGDALTLNVTLFKSFYFNASRLTLMLSVRNLLNDRDQLFSGYESPRVRRIRTADTYVYRPLDTRYLYAYPRTFYASISYKF